MKKDLPQKTKIGCIGQGWVGRHIADEFEARGFAVARYAKETPYNSEENKKQIAQCDVVFIAVPTPTTSNGMSDSIVRSVIPYVGKGKIAVIKSSVLPGMTDAIQKANPDIFVFHIPEFLTEANAAHDAAHPSRNIIGIPDVKPALREKYEEKAKLVLSVLPHAPEAFVCKAKEAEMIKFLSNCFLALKVIYANAAYDLAETLGADYEMVKRGLGADSRIGKSHLSVAHDGGRGAGGDCFIKDLAAFRKFYADTMGKGSATALFTDAETKNIELLAASGKDIRLLTGVYGEKTVEKFKKKK